MLGIGLLSKLCLFLLILPDPGLDPRLHEGVEDYRSHEDAQERDGQKHARHPEQPFPECSHGFSLAYPAIRRQSRAKSPSAFSQPTLIP